ncbi:hypothetical protein KQX54_019914 [Cotesia glomerata]|uniref:Uncharacterized protein n=1 Tax=Cotesia glomerata TaxID=32391 RepID=A0AAV7HLQ7_COTGL|nr:hypothetical protein KQX54_019914 [Cotesia glomerata]
MRERSREGPDLQVQRVKGRRMARVEKKTRDAVPPGPNMLRKKKKKKKKQKNERQRGKKDQYEDRIKGVKEKFKWDVMCRDEKIHKAKSI